MSATLRSDAEPGAPASVGCRLRAYGAAQASAAAISELRPPPEFSQHLPANLLRHADPQTTVSLAAVVRAIQDFDLDPAEFAGWGVLAAPRRFGRGGAMAELNRFSRRGIGAIFPILAPQFSLHALSGTISMVLRAHGPNFGVSGGPTHVADGLLAAATLLAESALPGVWLTLSQWLPESVLSPRGEYGPSGVCHALALALTPSGDNQQEGSIRVAFDQASTPTPRDVSELAAWFAAAMSEPEPWSCAASGGMAIQLTGVPDQPLRPAVPFPTAAVQAPSTAELREAG